jgi:hypothetical protein
LNSTGNVISCWTGMTYSGSANTTGWYGSMNVWVDFNDDGDLLMPARTSWEAIPIGLAMACQVQ